MMPTNPNDVLSVEVFNEVFHTLDEPVHGVDVETSGAIAIIAERVTKLVLEDKPLMIAPRLPDNREQNKLTLMAAIELGAQWVITVSNVYYLFATLYNLNVKLRSLGLPDFGELEVPASPDMHVGPYGSLEERMLHWHL